MSGYIKSAPIAEQIIRVVCSKTESKDYKSALVSVDKEFEGKCKLDAKTKDNQCAIEKNGIEVVKQTSFSLQEKEIYRYTFEGDAPIVVTKKTVDGERSFVENAKTVKVGDAFEGTITFEIEEDEAIYGLGQHEDGVLNYRNKKEYLYHNNMKIPMPVFLSSKNYAVFFDCTSMMIYEEKNNEITITFDAVNQIDYYVITGSCFDDLIAGIRMLTGSAVMLPKWAFGYVQSKERYKTQDEIIAVADEFQKRDIPVGCIVLDWLSWEDGKWGNKIFDKSRFPDAKSMVDELHEKDVAFMISIWPNCGESTENNAEFAKKGKLLCNYSTYDAFDEEARDMYWKQCEKELFAAGVDAWWCDSTEPFTPDWNGPEKRAEDVRYELAKESTNKYLDARNSNAYPLMHAKGIYEHQRAVCDTKRVCNLTRSGYPGTQKYGTILWSGDIAATWEVYKNQIAEGLSMAMSGIPYWTLDAGAFFVGNKESWMRWANQTEGTQPWFWHGLFEDGVKDKGYCELYTRWLQLAAFLPIMRSHGTDTPREPWQFGEAGTVYYDTIVKYIKLRYTMMPYTYSLASQVLTADYTMMRSLMFDFSHDKKVKDIADQFMFGTAFLVCPVTEAFEFGPESTPIQKEAVRDVYLPEGSSWYDMETKEVYEGGQTIQAKAPIDTIPVFIRCGSVIPLSSKASGEFDTVEIYGGSHGAFVYYEDNGMDYSYEQRNYASVPILWDAIKGMLVIENAIGGYKVSKTLTVRLIQPDSKVYEQQVTYTGERLIVKID